MIDNDITVSLDAPHASCDISGLYLVDGTQKVTNTLKVRHRVPECHSRELFKGILDDSASAYFSGLIHVFPDAQKTEAYQECHNLLLSRDARAFAQPQLEIYADDVKCSHGATNGRLNEDELFCLRRPGQDQLPGAERADGLPDREEAKRRIHRLQELLPQLLLKTPLITSPIPALPLT